MYSAISFDYHGVEKRHSKGEEIKPGPGTFNLPDLPRGPKFNIGNRFDGIPFDHPKFLTRRSLVPPVYNRPEYIDPQNYMGKSPGVRISPPPEKRIPRKDDPVGPGSYSPLLPNYSPKISVPLAKTSPSLRKKSPGPGEYSPEQATSYLFPALAKSISTVVPETKQGPGDTPGPGTYEPKILDRVRSMK